MSFEDRLARAPARLQPVLRTTGTVTDILASLFREPVVVVRLASSVHREGLERHVVLRGEASQRRFAFASSVIKITPATESLIALIENEICGIGEALKQLSLVQIRQVEDVWVEHSREIAPLFKADADELFFARRYTISINGEALITIVERFPASLYRETEFQ